MQLSVVIPSFNRVSLLSRALDSVLEQTWLGEMEIIVIDDGSTDETQQLIADDYPTIRYRYQANAGVSSARNLAIEMANGEWLAFLDSDDAWLPHKLAMQFALLEQTQLKVCHTEEIWNRNGVRVNQMDKHKKSGGYIFNQCLALCAMSPSSIIIHRSVLQHVGVFDPQLPACEDYDLWLRICAHYEVTYVPQPCITKYGGHDDQLSRRYWGMDRFRVIALEKLLSQTDESLALNSDMTQAAQATLVNKNTILLNGAIKHQNRALIRECEARAVRFA